MAAGMFAAATNLTTQIFSKPTSLSAYTLHSASGSASTSAASPAFGASSSTSHVSKGFTVGLWRVVGATHKTTGKDVSVWMFEKRVLDGVKGSAGRGAGEAKEWVIEAMKKEVSSIRLHAPWPEAEDEGDKSVQITTPGPIAHGGTTRGDPHRPDIRH